MALPATIKISSIFTPTLRPWSKVVKITSKSASNHVGLVIKFKSHHSTWFILKMKTLEPVTSWRINILAQNENHDATSNCYNIQTN